MARRPRESSPLDTKQRELRQEQEKLRQKMEDLQRLIENAPKATEKAERRRRDQLIVRAGQGATRFDSPSAISDRRYDAHTAVIRNRRGRMKKEEQEARLKFFALCVFLMIIVIYLYAKLAP